MKGERRRRWNVLFVPFSPPPGTTLHPLAMAVRYKLAHPSICQSDILGFVVGAERPETNIRGKLTGGEGKHGRIIRPNMSNTVTTVMLGLVFSKDSSTLKYSVFP